MDLFIIIVRIFHIFGGMFWLGTVWMTAIFLGPTSEAIGSDAEIGFTLRPRGFFDRSPALDVPPPMNDHCAT